MEDIEDLLKTDIDITISSRSRNSVMPKVRKRKINKQSLEEADIKTTQVNDSYIPGSHSIYVKTWGCSHNSSDSEYMAGQLASYGFKIVDDQLKADLWLLNSCTVKNPAEDHFRNAIETGRKHDKKVVVAGCVSQGAPKSEFLKGISIIGVQQIDRVIEVVEETLKGNSVRLLGPKRLSGKKQGGASLSLPKVRRNPLIEIISISTGCLNQCTYCKTKHARGDLGSYPIEEIVERAIQSFKEGVCEIWLTSEDTGAYGRDIGTTLPDLLTRLVDVIPEGCMLRLGMTNPPYILDHLEEMATILKHPRVYSFLHVPVQAGSNVVLSDMKREYTAEEFSQVVDVLKERVPGITIATDIICGFPTETAEDFEETLTLCRKYEFPSLFINQFYPRPGTPAAKMRRVPTKEVKRRSRILSEYFLSYEPYSNKLGELHTVLITEESHDSLHWVGHNKFYEQVLIPKEKAELGKMLQVRIIECGKFFMKGQLETDNFEPINPGLVPALPKGMVSGNEKVDLEERDKQEKVIMWSFIILITALITRLSWICCKFIL